VNNPEAIQRLATELEEHHPGQKNDCMILAEAEDIGFATLLSFDDQFVKRLAPHARLTLTKPAQLWEALAIPLGARPDKVPTPDNPLAREKWWRW
jgi:hypothetical protein